MWAHLQTNHGKDLPRDVRKDALTRGMYRPESLKKTGGDKTTADKTTGAANERTTDRTERKTDRTAATRTSGACNDRPVKKTLASTVTKRRASPEASSSRRESYAKELGPIPEFYVSDVNNNARPDSGPESDDGARSPGTPPPRRLPAPKRRRLESPEGERHHQGVGTEEPERTTSGTQTAGPRDVFGWDHHHTIVKEIRPNGTMVVTHDYIWRAGTGSVKYPCCESAAVHEDTNGKKD